MNLFEKIKGTFFLSQGGDAVSGSAGHAGRKGKRWQRRGFLVKEEKPGPVYARHGRSCPGGKSGGPHGFWPEGTARAGAFDPLAAQGRCGLCEKNCPLSAPACGKGAQAAEKYFEEMYMNENHEAPVDKGSGNDNLAQLFRRVARQMLRGRHHGPSHPAQGRVLSILTERESMSRKELMDLLEVRSGSLSELLGKLERHGLIAREQDQSDKRGFVLSVTDKGRAMAGEHGQWRGERAEELFAPLSREEQEQLGAILTKLLNAWEATGDEEGHAHEEKGPHGRGHRHGLQHLHHHGPGLKGRHGPHHASHDARHGLGRHGRHRPAQEGDGGPGGEEL